jgi:putative RNA 2'-phosphotransferase
MNERRCVYISKVLSKYLRHEPEALGLVLEPGGWVPVRALLSAAAVAGVTITRDELDHVVRSCDKKRFAFDDTGTKVRANQGHSADVDLLLEAADPPPVLYHGTAVAAADAIRRDGLSKMARHHVHLSPDTGTAIKVGGRHGRPVIFVVDAAKMRADGHTFFRSANGVWLVEHVPPRYLRLLTPENI